MTCWPARLTPSTGPPTPTATQNSVSKRFPTASMCCAKSPPPSMSVNLSRLWKPPTARTPPFPRFYHRLRKHPKAEPIGPVGFIRAGHADSTLAPDYPLHFAELGGGGIMGIGPYEAFLALDWLGPLKRVQTMGRITAAGVDGFALIQTEHERGMSQLHTGLDLLSRGDALLSAPRGFVTIHENWWNPSRATIQYIDGRTVELDEPYAAGGFNYETAHFCDLIREGKRESPEITHALSLAMARLLEAARTALGVHFPGQ